MANPRKPDNVLRMQGGFRKDRHGNPEKKPMATSQNKPPRCPSWMPPTGRAEFRRVVKALQPYNVLTVLDMGCVSQYCVLWSKLQADPDSFKAADHAQLRMIQDALGFTPSSRAKLSAMQIEDDDDDGDPLA